MIEPSQNLQQIFENSVNIAKELGHEYVTIEHIVFGIMNDPDSYALIEGFEIGRAHV